MPDRSSRHGLPDEWEHGSHARREYSATGAPDGFGAAKTEAIPAETDAYGPVNTDPFASPPVGYGTSPPVGYGASPPVGYGAGTADRFGGASTLGAEPFGARNTDPFGAGAAATGAAATGAFGTASFGTPPFGTEALGAGATGAAVRGAGTAGVGTTGVGTARPGAESAAAFGDRVPAQATNARSLLNALFDFGFTSFVTPMVIKALYVLIAIGTVLSALVFTILAFRASLTFGLVTLIFGDPLFVLIVLGIYRIALEFFMVIFRVAEDIRALRERGDLR